jgi:hypothetical protein
MPDRREKEIRLAPVDRQTRKKREQLFRPGDDEGELLVNLALAVRLVGGKPCVAPGDARQFAIRAGHFNDRRRTL